MTTIWLITRNDLISIAFPETTFGIFSALSGPLLTTNEAPSLSVILSRVPKVFLWNWLNLLVLDIANQRLPQSIVEDSVKKPWRPIPSKRITPEQARCLLLGAIPLVFCVTLSIGGVEESVLMMVLTLMYNDLAGADEIYIFRNTINAFGFVCYSSGSTRVACGVGMCSVNDSAYWWFGIVGAVVLSTLQIQDMADQEGDRKHNRKMMPLVLGDWTARWTIVIPVIVWSLVCPAFFSLHPLGYIIPLVLGGLLGVRIILCRTIAADRISWKLWCLWTVSLYCLPLVKNYHVLTR